MRVVVIHTPTPHTHARLCSRFSTLHSPFYILHSAGCGKGCEKCSPLSLFGWGMCPVGFTTSTYIAKWTHTCHIYTHIHICMYKGVVVGHMANGGWLGGWVVGWTGEWVGGQWFLGGSYPGTYARAINVFECHLLQRWRPLIWNERICFNFVARSKVAICVCMRGGSTIVEGAGLGFSI